MRLVLRSALALAALCAILQAWVTFSWIGWLDDHCSYPDECLSSWLPMAFTTAAFLWLATALCGAVAVTAAWLQRRPLVDLLALGVAWLAALISFWWPPRVQTSPGQPIEGWRLEADPFFWGGPGWTFTALLTAGAGALFGWQLLRSYRAPLGSTVSEASPPTGVAPSA